jgi:hypothetical protein
VQLVKKEELRKETTKFANACISERNKLRTNVQESRKTYELKCDQVNVSAGKFQKAADEKQKHKMRLLWHEDILEMNNSKVYSPNENMYLIAMHTANSLKDKYQNADVPQIHSAVLEFESSLSSSLIHIWSYMTSASIHLNEALKLTCESTRKVLQTVDPLTDTIDLPTRPHEKIEDMQFVPCGLWRDKGTLATDEYSATFLHNRLLELHAASKSCAEKCETIKQGIEGSKKLLEVYTNNPLNGDPTDVKEV